MNKRIGGVKKNNLTFEYVSSDEKNLLITPETMDAGLTEKEALLLITHLCYI